MNFDGNNAMNDDNQNMKTIINDIIQNALREPNPYEQAILLNQLREYLNRMCVAGYFGTSHARSCQRIVGIIHQLDKHDQNTITVVDDHSANENHGLQKRFFCNGFIGCRNAAG